MQLIKPDINLDFVGKRKPAILLSAVLLFIGIASLVMQGGPNYGIDFAGGTLVQVRITVAAEAVTIKDALKEMELGGLVVQIFLGLAVLNSNRRQSYRLAKLFAGGYVLYEFAQPYIPMGVFDWNDVYATIIGFSISVFMLSVVWGVVGSGDIPRKV